MIKQFITLLIFSFTFGCSSSTPEPVTAESSGEPTETEQTPETPEPEEQPSDVDPETTEEVIEMSAPLD